LAPSRTDLVIGGVLSLLGVGVSLEAVRLKVGSALDPQPGFFPLVGGILLIALGALQVGHALWATRPLDDTRQDRLGAPATLVGGLAIYVTLLPWAGYPLATALLTLLALRVQDTRWPSAIAASVLLALGSYFLFLRLGVPLPGGRLFAG